MDEYTPPDKFYHVQKNYYHDGSLESKTIWSLLSYIKTRADGSKYLELNMEQGDDMMERTRPKPRRGGYIPG